MSNGLGTPSNTLTTPTGAASGTTATGATAQHPPAIPAPDPKVTAAFALGWQVAELYRPGAERRPPANPDDLPTFERLTPEEQLTISLLQIDAGVARVSPAITVVNLALPDTTELSSAFAPPADDTARTEAVHAIHIALLSALTAAELRLGRAYGLGRALADTCRQHSSGAALAREFDTQRIAQLRSWLDDLASVLPPHAAKSVSRSLARWEEAVHAATADELVDYAPRQGELWRTMLSGEKAGVDMLTVNNYLEAAGGMITASRKVVEQFLRRFWWLSILIVLLFVGGIVLIAFAASSAASIVAGAAGVLASVGLTWKGVANALGGPAGQLEQHVWGAELDAAITDAITLLPRNDKETGGRRRLAADAQGRGQSERGQSERGQSERGD
jgi:hypothetical protein